MSVKVPSSPFLRVKRQYDGHAYGVLDGTAPTPTDGQDIEAIPDAPMQEPVAPGETLTGEFQIPVYDEPDRNVAVIIRTPPNPNGSFRLRGVSKLGTFTESSYGADCFNQPVGIFKAGHANGGWNVIKGWFNLANSDNPGVLKVQLAEARKEAAPDVNIVQQNGSQPSLPDGAVEVIDEHPGGSTDLYVRGWYIPEYEFAGVSNGGPAWIGAEFNTVYSDYNETNGVFGTAYPIEVTVHGALGQGVWVFDSSNADAGEHTGTGYDVATALVGDESHTFFYVFPSEQTLVFHIEPDRLTSDPAVFSAAAMIAIVVDLWQGCP
jgi:hypothetical protein